MKTILLSTVVVLLTIIVRAQQLPDYIINLKGDTLKCKITRPFLNGIKYTLPGDTAKAIEIDSIKEYYFAKKNNRVRAVYVNNKKKPRYIDVIENGKISLYEEVNTRYSGFSGASSTTTWFIGKSSDRVTELKTTNLFSGKSRQDRKDDFAEMLKDKPEVYDKYMAENKFGFDAIKALVHLYNTGQPLSADK